MAATAVPRLTWRRALAWRMRRQRLVSRGGPGDLVGVASVLCGLHAQVMSAAELSLWARLDGLDRAALRDALWTDRTLVKMWAARGTLYLLPAAELGGWLAALGACGKYGDVRRFSTDLLTTAVGEALDGKVLSREELADEVERRTGSAELAAGVRSSWGSYLKLASLRGLLCFAPSEGNQVRFTSPAHWVPGGVDRPEPEEAVRDLMRRYVRAYAPLTPEDLARWWLGPPMPKRGAKLLAPLRDELVEVDVGGRRAWALAADLDDMLTGPLPDAARLLPAFDPWVIGAARHAPLFDEEQIGRVYRPQGWVSPVLLVNGRIAGVWAYARTNATTAVDLAPFGKLPAWARAQLDVEARRLIAFLDG